VLEVEAAFGNSLSRSHGNELALVIIEQVLVGDPEPVS
jgi:hypothetical protein